MREPRQRSIPATIAAIAVAGLALANAATVPAAAATAVQVVYDNALRNGWQDWSWAGHDLSQTLIHQSAPNAISWEPDPVGGDWKGIYFHSDPGAAKPAVADYTGVRFWIDGAGGNQAVRLAIYLNSTEIGSKDLTPLPAVWTPRTVTWADLGVAATAFDGIVFQTNTPGAANQATAYVDDLELVPSGSGPQPGGPVTVAVDPGLDRRTLRPLLYGPQTGTDWSVNPGLASCGNSGSGVCDPNVNHVLCPGSARCCDPAGPAVPGAAGLRFIAGNSPTDTSVPVDLDAHVGDFVSHLVSRFGPAATTGNTGVHYYNLDNEPMLWNSTHRDAHPAPPGYDEVWAKGLAAATKVKSRDPGAEVLGPETWGWCDLWTSAKDAAAGDCLDGADRAAHGGLPG